MLNMMSNNTTKTRRQEMVKEWNILNKMQQTYVGLTGKSYEWNPLLLSHKSSELLDPAGRGPVRPRLKQPRDEGMGVG